jgi:hypothetical protein
MEIYPKSFRPERSFAKSVPGRGHVAVLDEGVVKVAVEALLDVGHVLDGGDGADGNLTKK